ncbi:MAG: toll/interleukin-1 receptor domain-containing protein [Spirochaetales bacterium]|nr:toll/interleukin-1 receptor domain-containing protein [Spirochaetales bacterium]
MTHDYIFISYSTHDSAFVHNLRQSLEESGICIWVDAYSMRGGSKLKKEIAEAIGKVITYNCRTESRDSELPLGA